MVAEPKVTVIGRGVQGTQDYNFNSSQNDFEQTYRQIIDFGFVRNPGMLLGQRKLCFDTTFRKLVGWS